MSGLRPPEGPVADAMGRPLEIAANGYVAPFRCDDELWQPSFSAIAAVVTAEHVAMAKAVGVDLSTAETRATLARCKTWLTRTTRTATR